jgi:hypothetical protein
MEPAIEPNISYMRSNKRRAFDKSPLADDFLILEAQRVLSRKEYRNGRASSSALFAPR